MRFARSGRTFLPARFLTGTILLLALAACDWLLPPPQRPSTDGYRAAIEGRADGRKVELEVAWKKGLGRREWGNEGARHTFIVRPDRGQAIELDESSRTARVRPLRPGETLWDSNGSFPFEPIRITAFDLKVERKLHPDLQVTKQALSDANVGLHPCDVLRIDRMKWDGTGLSEVRYFARDLDGLTVRREVRPIAGNRYLDDVEIDELVNVRIGADDELFEVPKGWRVETAGSLPDEPGSSTSGVR